MTLSLFSQSTLSVLATAAFTVVVSQNAEAATMLYYDSTSTGPQDALNRINSETDTALISSSSASSTLGARGHYAGTNTQTNVQGLGDGTDRMFRFGPNANGQGALGGALTIGHMNLGPYLEVKFTAAQDLGLESLSFNLFNNSQNASLYAARDVGLYVNVAGGAFSQFGALDTSATGNGNQGVINFTDNRTVLSGEEVILRLTFTDKTNLGTNLQSATRIGAIDICGTAIPEPSSALLSGFAFIGLLRRRR